MKAPAKETVIVFSIAIAGFFLVAHAAGIGAAFGVFLMMWANNLNLFLEEEVDYLNEMEQNDALR